MIKIGLDLAVRTVGIAIKQNDGVILYSSYKGKEKDYFKLQTEVVDWVFDGIMESLTEDHELILEGIFTGVNPKAALNAARTQGAVIDYYHRLIGKYPRIVTAVSARKNIDMAVQIHKAEIQLEIVKRYNLGEVSTNVRGEIIRARNSYEQLKTRNRIRLKTASTVLKTRLKKEQKLAKKEMDKTLSKMSTQVKKETGLDEHMADAIVLIGGE